eukprot:NODE_311_length_11244_cov_0.423419.p9 type:complete len:117 gc:universal NODE_311_length_11244_cov_0.423419:1047-697(-)
MLLNCLPERREPVASQIVACLLDTAMSSQLTVVCFLNHDLYQMTRHDKLCSVFVLSQSMQQPILHSKWLLDILHDVTYIRIFALMLDPVYVVKDQWSSYDDFDFCLSDILVVCTIV